MSSDLERAFETLAWALLPPDQQNFVHPYRPWAGRSHVDFAWPDVKVYVELQGGVWGKPQRCPNCGMTIRGQGGAHVRGARYTQDCEKHNRLVAEGWAPFNLTTAMLEDNPAYWLGLVSEAIKERRARKTEEGPELLPVAGDEGRA